MRTGARLLLLAGAFVCACMLHAGRSGPDQRLLMQQWSELTQALADERWEAANQSARALIPAYDDDPDGSQAPLRYLDLYSLAGRVATGSATHEELQAEAQGMIGRRLRGPARSIHAGEGGGLGPADGEDAAHATRAFDVLSTRSRTSILLFHDAALREPFDFVHHAGEMAILEGTLREVETNPNRTTLWIAVLHLDDAAIRSPARATSPGSAGKPTDLPL